MKGIIFNLLEDFIVEKLGEEKYEDIVAGAGLKTQEPFVGPGIYPDEDLAAILNGAVEEMGIAMHEALRMFGRHCFPKLAARFSAFTEGCPHPKRFLMTVNSTIHTEVKKLYPDATPPTLTYDDPAPDRLIVRYDSGRRLCKFMEGLIDGVSDYYGTPIRHSQKRCMLDGDWVCEFELLFPAKKGAPHGR